MDRPDETAGIARRPPLERNYPGKRARQGLKEMGTVHCPLSRCPPKPDHHKALKPSLRLRGDLIEIEFKGFDPFYACAETT